ncbi:MAG TPA: hypothetical protein VL463_04800 [Kofleriaceae bacterium]|jgi:hypothetical protein|nr:hypothetical protein [Kofleriaceae bacterium]
MRAALFVILAACGTSAATATDAAPDAGKDAACASTFGDVLTNAFGRVDGTVVAIVPPGDARCAQINGDHAVVQVQLGGAVYRMVVDVLGTGTDPAIRVRGAGAPLPAPAFAEGWHPGVTLDYATDLGVHSTDADWQTMSLDDATARISDAIALGAPIAVYATSSGGTKADSAHLIHREGGGHDGAIVLAPDTAHPTWLLFRFATQSF